MAAPFLGGNVSCLVNRQVSGQLRVNRAFVVFALSATSGPIAEETKRLAPDRLPTINGVRVGEKYV